MVGVYDTLPQVPWTKKVLEEQGILTKETKVYQDSTSSVLMENNRKQSSTKQTKHMAICYFYITDHVKNRNISIQHYPTKDMVTDYFTKSLQGSLFVKLHNYIIRAEYGDRDIHTHKSVLDQVDDKPDLDGNSECEIDANPWDKKLMWGEIHTQSKMMIWWQSLFLQFPF